MKHATLSRRTLQVVTIVGSMISLPAIFHFVVPATPQTAPATAVHIAAPAQPVTIRPGLPARLTIPKIGVNAAIDSVGVTPQGAVGVPKGPTTAAWFNLGPRPGETGNAVIDGHFGWKNGIPAVFDNVSKLHKGDKIYVKDQAGTTVSFVVRELRLYGQNDNAGTVFRSADRNAHLVLITCEGIWNKIQKSYSDRLVVFADKEILDNGD